MVRRCLLASYSYSGSRSWSARLSLAQGVLPACFARRVGRTGFRHLPRCSRLSSFSCGLLLFSWSCTRSRGLDLTSVLEATAGFRVSCMLEALGPPRLITSVGCSREACPYRFAKAEPERASGVRLRHEFLAVRNTRHQLFGCDVAGVFIRDDRGLLPFVAWRLLAAGSSCRFLWHRCRLDCLRPALRFYEARRNGIYWLSETIKWRHLTSMLQARARSRLCAMLDALGSPCLSTDVGHDGCCY